MTTKSKTRWPYLCPFTSKTAMTRTHEIVTKTGPEKMKKAEELVECDSDWR